MHIPLLIIPLVLLLVFIHGGIHLIILGVFVLVLFSVIHSTARSAFPTIDFLKEKWVSVSILCGLYWVWLYLYEQGYFNNFNHWLGF